MKKLLATALATLLMATQSFASISLNVDNKALDTDVSPVIVEGRTMVPVRAIFEALGAEVQWNDETKMVTANNTTTNISLIINDANAIVNGSTKVLDVPAQIIEGRTMVPARFVAESLNCTVGWNAETQTVSVSTTNNTSVSSTEDLPEYLQVALIEQEILQNISTPLNISQPKPTDPSDIRNLLDPLPVGDAWVSGVALFDELSFAKDDLPFGTEGLKSRQYFEDYSEYYVYCLYKQESTGSIDEDSIYFLNEITDEFLNSSNISGTFNGIKMQKINNVLYFSNLDLKKIGYGF